MADPKGFMTIARQVAERRDPTQRVQDWDEVYPGSPGRATPARGVRFRGRVRGRV